MSTFHQTLVRAVLSLLVLGASSVQLDAKSYALRLPDGRLASISVPSGCEMTKVRGENTMMCSVFMADGGTRTVSLLGETLSAGRMLRELGLSEEAFSRQPTQIMSALLKAAEEATVLSHARSGQNIVAASTRAVSPPPASGMDVCLSFEFDVSGDTPSGPLRVDNTGLRCLDYDEKAKRFTSIKIEYVNGHLDQVKRRTSDFEREAQQVFRSLRVQ